MIVKGKGLGGTVPAVMTSPVPGSLLSGPSVAFQWSLNDADAVGLHLGTEIGKADLGTPLNAKTDTYAVNNLPVDGRTIYARLFSRIGEHWQSKDYSYSAYTPTPDPDPIEQVQNVSSSNIKSLSILNEKTLGTDNWVWLAGAGLIGLLFWKGDSN